MRPRASVARQRDQILRTLLILGGLSGGDSEPRTLLPSIGTGMGRATSKIKTAGATRSPFRIFGAATTCGDTACLQQECEAGIAEVSHMLAIFRQQLCSSSVMFRPDAKQAARGCAKRIRTATRIFEALFTIVILPHYTNKVVGPSLTDPLLEFRNPFHQPLAQHVFNFFHARGGVEGVKRLATSVEWDVPAGGGLVSLALGNEVHQHAPRIRAKSISSFRAHW
jgi:hypothetical protein